MKVLVASNDVDLVGVGLYIYKIINRSIGPLSLFFHIFFVNQKKKQTIFTFPHDVLFIKSIPVNLYSC